MHKDCKLKPEDMLKDNKKLLFETASKNPARALGYNTANLPAPSDDFSVTFTRS